MYEVEIKIEVSEKERERLLRLFAERGFADRGITPQEDYYVRATPSKYGAFDVERFRTEPGKIFYTKKVWEVENGKPIRREDEREATTEEFEEAKRRYPEALKIRKDRHWFAAQPEGRSVSLTIDSVKFDHSPSFRHFMEAEIDVRDRGEVEATKNFLRGFIADLINLPPAAVKEAAGMFAMAHKKL